VYWKKSLGEKKGNNSIPSRLLLMLFSGGRKK
jgi:hypothetical protein